MTEAELEVEITDLCEELGLLWHLCTDSRRCRGKRGFPDLVVAGPGGHLFRELKGEYGTTSAGQDAWHWTLHQGKGGGPCPYKVWWPEDWRSGKIRDELEKIS